MVLILKKLVVIRVLCMVWLVVNLVSVGMFFNVDVYLVVVVLCVVVVVVVIVVVWVS